MNPGGPGWVPKKTKDREFDSPLSQLLPLQGAFPSLLQAGHLQSSRARARSPSPAGQEQWARPCCEALDQPRGSVSLGRPPVTRDNDQCLPRLVGVRVDDPTLSGFPPWLVSSVPSVLKQ